ADREGADGRRLRVPRAGIEATDRGAVRGRDLDAHGDGPGQAGRPGADPAVRGFDPPGPALRAGDAGRLRRGDALSRPAEPRASSDHAAGPALNLASS